MTGVTSLNSTSLLYGTAASIALVHTLLGPDHYLPFIAMSRARKWSLTKTMIITVLCGVGHVLSSVAIGAIGIVFGVAVLKLESVESFRSELTGYMMIGFGLIYLVWGIRHALRNKPHSHWHVHADGSVHTHEHTHTNEHLHVHEKTNPSPERERRVDVQETGNWKLEAEKMGATGPDTSGPASDPNPNREGGAGCHAQARAGMQDVDHRVPLAAGPPVIRDATVRERETSTYQNVETTSFPPYQGGTEGGQDEFVSEMESTHPSRDRQGSGFDPNPDREGGATLPNRAREEAANAKLTSTLAPWILFTVFLFGPCELLIPVLMYPAAAADIWSVVGVTLVFGFTTIATMTTIVAIAHISMNRVFTPRVHTHHTTLTQRITRSPLFQRLSQYSHALAGFVILLCGTAMMLGW